MSLFYKIGNYEVFDITNSDFICMYVVANRGKGKTVFSVNYALEYRNQFPNNKIYANFKLKGKLGKNFQFIPYLFLPYTSLHDCLIIIDEISTLDKLTEFIKMVSSISRKSKVHIILICQYYTQIEKSLRTLSEYEVRVEINDNQNLLAVFIEIDNTNHYVVIENSINNVKSLFDTYEKPLITTESIIKNEILIQSNNLADLELNICLFTKNQAKRNKMYKELSQDSKFNVN